MELIDAMPRPDVGQRITEQGSSWYHGPSEPTWFEDRVYVFEEAETEALKAGAREITRMLPAAVERIISDHRLLDRLDIPEEIRPYLRRSWERRDPGFYGRIDFCFNPERSPYPVFYELNADTSGCLHEVLVQQPDWWESHGNRIFPAPAYSYWDTMPDAFRAAFRETPLRGGHIVFVSIRENDERMKGAIGLQKFAEAAGYSTSYCNFEDLQFRGGRVYDFAGHEALTLFKVFWPWEKLIHMPFGRMMAEDKISVIEPIWKFLTQNKIFPVILWQQNEGHPNLLPSYFEDDPKARLIGRDFVRKPIMGREGKNIEIFRGNECVEASSGEYAKDDWVRQAIAELPEFRGRHPLMGVFLVRGEPVNLIIRESKGLITRCESPAIAHVTRHRT